MQEVKEMKKVLFVFLMLCLLLPGIALAEVQSQVSTPAEYKGTYNSPSGKSHMAPAPGQEYITLGYTRGADC